MAYWLSVLKRDVRGGVLTVTALTLPVVVAISALSVDLGRLYMVREAAIGAALYAAEAGAGRLPDTARAEALARRVASSHLARSGNLGVQPVDVVINGSLVTVSMDVAINGAFSRFVGMPVLETRVSGQAGN